MSSCLFNDVSKQVFFYETYLAMRLHFNSTYDFFKFHGKLKNRIETKNQVDKFINSKEFCFVQALVKRRNSKLEMVEFLLANLVKNPNVWLAEMTEDYSEQVFLDWKKTQESLTYTFINDLNFILSHNKHFNSYFISENGDYAPIFQYLMNEEIKIETAIILNKILKFGNRFAKVKKDFILEDIINKILKYDPFVSEYHNLNEESLKKFKKIVKEKAEESLNVLPF